MPFVKLDCGMLDSTIWMDRDAKEVFITALLMAVPHVLEEPTETLQVRTLDPGDYLIPEGLYGMVHAAGIGIIHRSAGVSDEDGYLALERLCSPEESSRSQEHDGRRLQRINGGYIVLNYNKFRERDYTAADRSKRWRERQRATAQHGVTSLRHGVAIRRDTQAEADVEEYTKRERERFAPPALKEIKAYWAEANLGGDPEAFLDHYTANGWVSSSGRKIRSWQASARNWSRREPAFAKRDPVSKQEAAASAGKSIQGNSGFDINEKPFEEWTDEDAEIYLLKFPDHREKLNSALLQSRGKGLPEKNP